MSKINRRNFILSTGAGAALLEAGNVKASEINLPENTMQIPDDNWKVWLDKSAKWENDDIYLPNDVVLEKLPINEPSIGFAKLETTSDKIISIPSTIEQHFWGVNGFRPYGADEYRYAEVDNVPQYGAYKGVSWWSKNIKIPNSFAGKRIILHIPSARFRAEVYLNGKLVGYSIMAECEFDCDLTNAAKPNEINQLNIRITNPGGRFDWRDSTTMKWGKYKFFASHGFGGIDGGLTISAHPKEAHISDAWILNTDVINKIFAYVKIKNNSKAPSIEAINIKINDKNNTPIAIKTKFISVKNIGEYSEFKYEIIADNIQYWDLENPNLYTIKFTLNINKNKSVKEFRFGFRWFNIDGLGTDAHLKLNHKRIKLYSAISWGYWGYNGLYPTNILAKREIDAAFALGLNCLHAHRNIAKKRVTHLQDERGLLRVIEPGGGRHAISKDLKPGEKLSFEDQFSVNYMFEKCRMMARMFRSHPSVIQYTLQNEISANLDNPLVRKILEAIHEEDPSRIIILNDGFVERGAAQAMFLPYDKKYYNSREIKWGGWWVNHQGAGDQWYDKFYANKDEYIHKQKFKPAIVEFGEMQGCAVADNHSLMVADILANGKSSYDLIDHIEILDATNKFIKKWGFDKAFPSSELLYFSIGRKAYESWQNYMENIRIGDEVDMAAISGWESTSIENHSGIVDNLRYFKSSPDLIKSALHPVRAIAKQRKLVFEKNEKAVLDIYFFNDTNQEVKSKIELSLQEPDGKITNIASYDTPENVKDKFSYLLATDVITPPLEKTGLNKIIVTLKGHPTFTRDIWVIDTNIEIKANKIAIIDIPKSFEEFLKTIPNLKIEPYTKGTKYDCIISSGLSAAEIAKKQVGEQTGLEAQPNKDAVKQGIKGKLNSDILEEIANKTPVFIYAPDDDLADGIAGQLSSLNYFKYEGQVGNLRAPWMGNWNFIRSHEIYSGIPSDQATNTFHQAEGQLSNGLIIDGEGIEIIGAYSRDHDRKIGAASFILNNKANLFFARMPPFVSALHKRYILNAINFLANKN